MMANVFFKAQEEELSQLQCLTDHAAEELQSMYERWVDSSDDRNQFSPTTIYRVAATLRLVSSALEDKAGIMHLMADPTEGTQQHTARA